MKQFDEQLLKTITELSDHFAIETIQRWTKAIKRRKLVNTRQLLNSLDQETRADLGRMVAVISFAFEEHGRFHDIKGKRWREQPPIDEIIAWVKEKGISAFGRDPKPNKTKPKTDERRANEIAWGIAKNRISRGRRDRARPWFQSTFYKGLNDLQEELIIGVQDRSIEGIKEALTERLKRGSTGKYF